MFEDGLMVLIVLNHLLDCLLLIYRGLTCDNI